MLSFSCPQSASSGERSSPNAILPYFHLTSSACNRNTGTIIKDSSLRGRGVCFII
jgi:hypothetical protein